MRKSLAALATATLLALSSACGGPSGGDDATPAAATASAAAQPAAAASASSGLTRENFVDRLGAALTAAGSAHLEMESAGEQGAMQGDVQLGDTLTDARTRLTMDLGAMPVELRLVEGVAYLKLGQMTGGKYVKVDLTDPKDPIAQRFGAMTDQVDPRAQLETFQSALVEFEDQGSGGRIDGVETTRIRLVLDTSKVMRKHGGKGRTGSSVPKRLESVLYVGSDDLLRKMTLDPDGKSTTLTWSKWGEPVEVSAPPAADVTDSGVLAGLGALNPRA
ncbi:hypothetical protein AFL01nite_07150 [Aeromicrobium flavum]|uniref:Lipoprotein n=1 Tax=Aeromicrobium flavum TaxID=416568 RepID=A0A512HSF3_9ACTN|nr:hypothetical protein [Aeromicrobium flavum]GEO88388.1 hypothetical protein AFL01nite_07150 [Aeromicrobium flavum]